jgi:photosystem II stability/assembly factor-like uncharacterized protein
MNRSFLFSLKTVCAFFVLFFLSQSNFAQTGWTFVRKESAVDFVSVFFTSANDGWVGGDGGYVGYTTDGGRSWIKQNIGTRENVNEVYFRGDDNGYILAGRQIFITRDKGKSWRETRVIELAELNNLIPEFLSIRFADRRRGFIVGSVSNKNEIVVDSLVLQTTDGGETWRRIRVPSKVELFHIDFVGDERGWIVGDAGTILATENGGETWQTQFSGTDRALRGVDFRDKDEGYAVGGRGTILRTENGGKTWSKALSNSTESLFRVNFTDDKTGFIVGRNGTILRSDDKGRTWIKQDSKTTEPLYGLFMDKKFGWAVGGKGIVLKYQK